MIKLKQIIIGLKNFFNHLFRRIFKIIFNLILLIIFLLIFIITFERNTRGKVTIRKIKRIRKLTKFKLYLYKYFKNFFKWIRNDYFENLYNNFSFLIEK